MRHAHKHLVKVFDKASMNDAEVIDLARDVWYGDNNDQSWVIRDRVYLFSDHFATMYRNGGWTIGDDNYEQLAFDDDHEYRPYYVY